MDKNHDGTMDTYFASPDATSQASPMVFWLNNDHDGAGVGHDAEMPDQPDSANNVIRPAVSSIGNQAVVW